jgi:Pyrimidine dimer DNA glycosylase
LNRKINALYHEVTMHIQTFLPYQSFIRSARTLDNKRLGKQRVEAYQILRILLGESRSKGWANHPAVRMWRGHEGALHQYLLTMMVEWEQRGFRNILLPVKVEFLSTQHAAVLGTTLDSPKWTRSRKFHRAHQSNLIRKDPAFYQPKFPGVPADLPYVWST